MGAVVIGADDPMTVCLAVVDAAHEDADPDVEAPAGRCVTC